MKYYNSETNKLYEVEIIDKIEEYLDELTDDIDLEVTWARLA